VIKCGGIAVPVNPDSTEDEIAYYVEDSQALVVASEVVAQRLQIDSTPLAVLGKVLRQQLAERFSVEVAP
jgi:long-subunit acyl-CoA synthetase (AMP-forming)